ncbi:MAG: hypothetical protein M1823_005894 [Watsoniomyces obsoletus]|nr:MAG: hypothetical protein M1823_005894 [Watsoniomyces obsoletus]
MALQAYVAMTQMANASVGDQKQEETQAETKQTYKSWKKKYRKMRVEFEHKMRESDTLFRAEQKAKETIRRLNEEKEGLLDLLLDINEDEHIPARLRFELPPPDVDAEPAEDFPGLAEFDKSLQKKTKGDCTTGGNHQESEEEEGKEVNLSRARAMYIAKTLNEDTGKPKKFSELLHLPHPNDMEKAGDFFADEFGIEPPLTYFHPEEESAWLDELDKTLSEEGPKQRSKASQLQSASVIEREEDKEMALKNPVSVYNWLRRNQPQVFLQDKEAMGGNPTAEKNNGHGGGMFGLSTIYGSKPTASTGGNRTGSNPTNTTKSRNKTHQHVDDTGLLEEEFDMPPIPPPKSSSSRNRRKRGSDESKSKPGPTKRVLAKVDSEGEGLGNDEEDGGMAQYDGAGDVIEPRKLRLGWLKWGGSSGGKDGGGGGGGGGGGEKGGTGSSNNNNKRKRDEDKGYRPKDGANGRAARGSRRNRKDKRSSSGTGKDGGGGGTEDMILDAM